jgi:hypothetical protein
MTRAAVIALAALAALTAVAVVAPDSAGRPTRVIDRTVLCATDPSGGIYEVEIMGRGGTRTGRGAWNKPATVKLTTGSTGSAAQALDNAIGWAIAGTPTADADVIADPFVGFAYPIRVWGAFTMHTRCRPSRRQVPLSRKGLDGGPTGKLDQTYDCETPRRVLVRMRAAFEQPTELRRHDTWLFTRETVLKGSIAVRTESGRPVLLAEAYASGKANIFISSARCFRD